MQLNPNARLGPYEIAAPLGAGGMGEVYRARDTRLDRDVAIKVLPEAMARDTERILRFEREAKALATLSHPNIAAIYGFEEYDGKRFLVMELAEGETLADRLERGAMPIDESLDAARMIAEALEAAHDKGIVHRDLKPANLKIAPDGTVKVLDFGLAKALSPDSSRTDIANSPTITAQHTRPGVILGTAAYMSPEQACGKPVDKRTDIWSFGCVLFECLSGRRPFHGETSTDLIAKILERDPDWTELPDATPPTVRRLIQRSLVKDRRKRLRDMGDAALELEEALLGRSRFSLPADVSLKHANRGRRAAFSVLVALFAFALGLVVGTMLWRQVASSDLPGARLVARYTVALPPNTTIGTGRNAPLGIERPSLAISPDGTILVYVGVSDGVSRLYIRRVESLAATPMPETEGAFDPFFSDNGQWVAFFADGKLKRVSPLGGAPVSICEAPLPKGGSWGSGDQIVFGRHDGLEICTVSSGGGTPKTLLKRAGGGALKCPQLMEGGMELLYTEENLGLRLLSLETNESQTLVPKAEVGIFIPTGHLMYLQEGTIAAVPFLWPQRILGDSHVPLGVDIRTSNYGILQLAFSKTGTLAYIPGGRISGNTLSLVDATGNSVQLGCPPRNYGTMEFSSDGQRLAIEVHDIGCDIWVYDLVRGTFARLTTDGVSRAPLWSRDGMSVLFSSAENGERGIFAKAVDGGGERRLVLKKDGRLDSLSPDGRYAVLSTRQPETKSDLWCVRLDEPDELDAIRNTTFQEWGAAVAPDSKHFAYVSDETGRYEVYVAHFPDCDGTQQVSYNGGEEPVWSPNGDQLYYRNGDKWMAAPIQTDAKVSFGTPYLVFEGPYVNCWDRSYAVAPDTGRFLVIESPMEEAPTQITVVLNWFEELKTKFPAGTR